MNEDITLYLGMSSAPVTIALTEVVKKVFPDLDQRWVPVIALCMSVAVNEAGTYLTGNREFGKAAFIGIIAGLSAIGLFSGVRATSGR